MVMRAVFVFVSIGLFLSASTSIAQERSVVRDTLVLEGSGYESTLNSRSRILSTLPRSIAGRRPISGKESGPMPLGMITFEGQPQTDFDVLIEYSGRMMTHFPAGSSRSKRVLWGRITSSKAEASLPTAADHWLGQLDFRGRVACQTPSSTPSPCLLYDIEYSTTAEVTLAIKDDLLHVKNMGKSGVKHAAVFRPDGEGKVSLGYVAVIEAADPDAAGADGDKPAKSEPDPAAVQAVGNLVGNLLNAVVPQSTTPAAEAPPVEVPKANPETKPGTLAEVKFDAADTVADSIARYLDRIEDLTGVERQYVDSLLMDRVENATSAVLVYQLDEAALAKLVPLELTPFPDRLIRIGLVIVPDADPSLSERVHSLVQQLGDNSWQKREEAEQELRRLGRVAERQLELGKGSSDWEIKDRSTRLLTELATVGS